MSNKGIASKATGKLGILLPGMGAVATTFIAGVYAVNKGISTPIGSLTQMGRIRVGKRVKSGNYFRATTGTYSNTSVCPVSSAPSRGLSYAGVGFYPQPSRGSHLDSVPVGRSFRRQPEIPVSTCGPPGNGRVGTRVHDGLRNST